MVALRDDRMHAYIRIQFAKLHIQEVIYIRSAILMG